MAERNIPFSDDDSSSSSVKSSRSTALIRRPQVSKSSIPKPTVQQQRQQQQPPLPEDLVPLQALFQTRQSSNELTAQVESTFTREMGRLSKIPPQSAEYNVSKTYLEWIVALPWRKATKMVEEISMEVARERLESGHVGLESVKRRVVEYLAVYRYVSGLTST